MGASVVEVCKEEENGGLIEWMLKKEVSLQILEAVGVAKIVEPWIVTFFVWLNLETDPSALLSRSWKQFKKIVGWKVKFENQLHFLVGFEIERDLHLLTRRPQKIFFIKLAMKMIWNSLPTLIW